MAISRATQSPASIHRSACLNRLRRRDVDQARCLWWWGKHSRGWWASQQDDMEERLRRHQALMMHRYTKALRRRSLWDRDTTPSYPSWSLRACKMDRDMSSTDSLRAKVEDRQPEKKTEKQAWHEFHKDFDSFKRAVDRAVARDAYGALFGRRLRSPDTANNSSWTSWSWIFDPKEIKEDPVPEPVKHEEKAATTSTKPNDVNNAQHVAANPVPSVSHSSTSSKTTTTLQSSHSIIFQDRTAVSTEYVYDPISGRKVPQTSISSTTVTGVKSSPSQAAVVKKDAPKKGLIESLFTEHGTIPVKVYKPPKVYGFTGETKPKPKPDPTTSTSGSAMKNPDNSRKREYDNLRLRTLGNNIDATNFNCEPWNNREVDTPSVDVEEPAEKRVRISPALNEEAALFSGTTYASKSDQPTIPSNTVVENEDFRLKQGMTMSSLRTDSSQPVRTSERITRIEPAVDRASSSGIEIPVKKFASKLQPAIDRSSESTRLEPATERAARSSFKNDRSEQSTSTKTATAASVNLAEQQDKREDVDLLRASDIRAGVKSARITKQALDDKKQQNRENLEQHFERNATSDKNNLESVWKHIKQYPTGIVAKTMQSIGVTDMESKEKPTPKAAQADIRFSEPTVRPDVDRNLRVEQYTQVFEPKIAGIVDQAKSVKRELHDVSLGIGDMVNARAITAMANRDFFLQEDEPKPLASKTVESAKPVEKASRSPAVEAATSSDLVHEDALFVVLLHPVTGGNVQVLRMNKLTPGYSPSKPGFSTMSTLGSLINPSAFIKHFADLDKKGYELIDGAPDVLVFRKRVRTIESAPPMASSLSSKEGAWYARLAAVEAASQPRMTESEHFQAAKVLDEIPTSIPAPGPAAPTAPTSSQGRSPTKSTKDSTTSNKAQQLVDSTPERVEPDPTPIQSQLDPAQQQDRQSKRGRSRVRMTRQEEVFSGQQRLKPQTTALPDPEHFQKQRPSATAQSQQRKQEEYESTPRLGFFARVRRAIRRTVLTAFAFGAGAYGIGVVAEGLQARAQIEQGEAGGPMKRLVLENDAKRSIGDRQRAGIFSTESSR